MAKSRPGKKLVIDRIYRKQILADLRSFSQQVQPTMSPTKTWIQKTLSTNTATRICWKKLRELLILQLAKSKVQWWWWWPLTVQMLRKRYKPTELIERSRLRDRAKHQCQSNWRAKALEATEANHTHTKNKEANRKMPTSRSQRNTATRRQEFCFYPRPSIPMLWKRESQERFSKKRSSMSNHQ